MSEMDDFAALKCHEYRAYLGGVDLGPFFADPVIRFPARRQMLSVFDGTTGAENCVECHVPQPTEIELSLRDGIEALETATSATSGFSVLKFTSTELGADELTFHKVSNIPKIQFTPSGKFGHRAVLTFYAVPDSNGTLFSAAPPASNPQ